MKITKESIKAAEQVLIDHGIEHLMAATILEEIGLELLNATLYNDIGATFDGNFRDIITWGDNDLQDAYNDALDTQRWNMTSTSLQKMSFWMPYSHQK